MKCGKCGKNEANYYYRETINGVTREVRLCADCAREEGLESAMARRFDMGFGRSFFADFFDPFESLFCRSFRPMMMGVRSAETQGKAESAPLSEARRAEAPAGAKESGCDEALVQRRERNKLEAQLKEAVAREDYETAITLRDQLKKMD